MISEPENATPFAAARIAVLTVSDTRTAEEDTSGDLLCGRVESAGHVIVQRDLVTDDVFRIRATVSVWIAQPDIDCILITGGTGITGRDTTPEAVHPLLVREIPGFGELFRQMSLDEIGTSAIQSRALAGTANATLIFCLPGSTGACRLAWDRILAKQLDARTRPCNFMTLISRLEER